MLNIRALGTSLMFAAVLAGPLYYYWAHLSRGMQAPDTITMLTQMEQNGAPDFTLEDLSGQPVSLSQFKGKVVLVNFWATWCAPCVKEFPSLQNLVRFFRDDLVVVAISYDRQREDIDSFIKAFGGVPKNFIILWDKNRTTSGLYGADVLPETFILDQNHRLLRKIAGEAIWDEPVAIRFFSDLINPAGKGESTTAPALVEEHQKEGKSVRGNIKTH